MRRMMILKKVADVTVANERTSLTLTEPILNATLVVETKDPNNVYTSIVIPKFEYNRWYTVGGYDDAISYQLHIMSDDEIEITSSSESEFTVTIYKLG